MQLNVIHVINIIYTRGIFIRMLLTLLDKNMLKQINFGKRTICILCCHNSRHHYNKGFIYYLKIGYMSRFKIPKQNNVKSSFSMFKYTFCLKTKTNHN